jgi:hypothetical protein
VSSNFRDTLCRPNSAHEVDQVLQGVIGDQY